MHAHGCSVALRLLVTSVLLGAWGPPAARAQALPATEIFKRVSPSVVLIRSANGFGSGVVANSQGVIMTSYHVVNPALDLEVFVQGEQGGKLIARKFTNVEVMGVHPQYDLALLRVKTDGVPLPTVPFTRTQAKTGDKCYVIGNPAGADGKALRNSISSGIVSADDRELEGVHYIQTTAPINPGNSGGALCNEQGQLIGIVAAKISDSEGLGFAVPIQNVSGSSFVKAVARKGDPKKARELTIKADQCYGMAHLVGGLEGAMAVARAIDLYKQALQEDPSSWKLCEKLGTILIDCEEYAAATPYVQKAVALNPTSVSALYMLGMCTYKTGKDEDAERVLKKGLATTNDPPRAGDCAELLSDIMLKNNRPADAAYYAAWAKAQGTSSRWGPSSQLESRFQAAAQQLPDAQFRHVTGKTSGFSEADHQLYLAMNTDGNEPKTATTEPAPLEPIPAEQVVRIAGAAPPPGTNGIVKKLPGVVTDAKLAYGGAFLILQYKDLNKISVLNIAQAAIVKHVDVPDADTVTATAGKWLFTYSPSDSLFRKWDLDTFTCVHTNVGRFIGPLSVFEMGLDNPSLAVISYSDGTNELSNRHLALWDARTAQTIPFSEIQPLNQRNGASHFAADSRRDLVNVRPNRDLSAFAVWKTSGTSDLLYARRNGTRVVLSSANLFFGIPTISSDNTTVFGSGGCIADPQGNALKKTDFLCYYAVSGPGNYYLEVGSFKGDLVLRHWPDETEMCRRPMPCTWRTEIGCGEIYTSDRHIFGVEAIDRVVIVDNAAQSVRVLELGMTNAFKVAAAIKAKQEQAAALAAKNAGMAPGSHWQKQVAVPSGAVVRVEDAPQGVRYDHQSMTLSWDIPADQPAGTVTILLNVTDPAKGESYITEKVLVGPAPDAAP